MLRYNYISRFHVLYQTLPVHGQCTAPTHPNEHDYRTETFIHWGYYFISMRSVSSRLAIETDVQLRPNKLLHNYGIGPRYG